MQSGRFSKIGTPSATMSASSPGNSDSSSSAPRAINRCTWRSCGVAERLAGSGGSASRSNTVTWSANSASTLAAHNPPMLAPITTACLIGPIGSHASGYIPLKR